MGRLTGQASPDFVMSAMIFSLAALFVFFHLTRTYYSRVWEISSIEKKASAQNLALFLTSEKGNWEANPFNSSSIAFGGETLNSTRTYWFFGMPHQTVQDKLNSTDEVKIELWKLPNIGITSDLSEIYLDEVVDVNFRTTENATLYLVLVGTQSSTGISRWNSSTGEYHNFELDLPTGAYNLNALAVSGEKYGAYEAGFRVVR